MRIMSWNVLKGVGARADDVARLIERHRPGLVLLQEATEVIDALPDLVGGHYVRKEMLGRGHGLAAWSPVPFEAATADLPRASRLDLPAPVFRLVGTRLVLLVRLGPLLAANVHLDHGQIANRRQLRHVFEHVRPDMVAGDFNALGATTLPGYTDVGPRRGTHWAYGLAPLRLDRCLVRGMEATATGVLEFGRSDHRPILVDVSPCAAADGW